MNPSPLHAIPSLTKIRSFVINKRPHLSSGLYLSLFYRLFKHLRWSAFLPILLLLLLNVHISWAIDVAANLQITTDPGRQNETTIAINPTNPLHLVGGAHDGHDGCGVYTTDDGGQSWQI